MQRSSVLFPLPLAPITTSTSPWSTLRSMPSRTRLSPKLLTTPSRRTIGAPAASGERSSTLASGCTTPFRPLSVDLWAMTIKPAAWPQQGPPRLRADAFLRSRGLDELRRSDFGVGVLDDSRQLVRVDPAIEPDA